MISYYRSITTCPTTAPPYVLVSTLLWLFLVLPSAYLNSWFTLDLGGIFLKSTQFPQSLAWILSPYNGSGRYFPFYWLYYAFLYKLFGIHLVGYYLVQSVLFLVSVLFILYIFAHMTSRGVLATLLAVSIFLSSPNAETLYTLCKAEPLVFFFTACILLLFARRGYSPNGVLIKYAAITILFALSLWSKETSVALLIFAMAGATAAFLYRRRASIPNRGTDELRKYTHLLVALGVGFILSRLPYVIFKASRADQLPYTTFKVTWNIIADNALFYVTQQPDVIGFGVIAVVLVLIVIRSMVAAPNKFTKEQWSAVIFVFSLLAMAWASVALFLVWRWPMGYYLFLPSIIFRFGTGYGIYSVISSRALHKKVRRTGSLSMTALLLHAAVYLWYVGSSQVEYSKIYTEALVKYLSVSHNADSLIFEAYPFYAEQVGNTIDLFRAVFHQERRVYGIADLINPAVVTREMRGLRSVSDADLRRNQSNWPQKDDYVMAVTGDKLATWQIRGVAPWYSDGSDLQKDGAYDMRMIAEERQYAPELFFNIWTHWWSAKRTYIGYQLYKVISGPRFTWFGKYPDGWLGRRAELTLYPPAVGHARIYFATSKYNPQNRVSVFKDKQALNSVPLIEGKEEVIDLLCDDHPTTFRFEIERIFVPKTLRLNKDSRELGVRVRVEPFAPKKRGS